MKRFLLFIAALVVAIPLYTMVMARLDLVTPPPMVDLQKQADLVEVGKSERVLTLSRNGEVFASYQISLGAAGDDGHKQHEGDERTPEGLYEIDWRNDGSFAYLSLHISYPNAQDIAAAAAKGEDPGGFIMIHGIANGWGWLRNLHLAWDWADGCIAVSNKEMREICAHVPNGTPIKIEA